MKELEQQIPQRFAEWEQQAKQPAAWTPLNAVELASTNGAQLAKRDDLSVVASGPNGKTTYKLVARTELPAVTGVKLEVLTDDSLPSKGPGRAPNGNFVLTEFRGEWAPESEPEKKTPLVLQNAQADFSQEGYAVQTAIDGQKADQGNGWATHPKTGVNRTAVFETRNNVGSGPGLFTFWLDQEYTDGKHTIGRFRISVTNTPRPITLDGLPKNIADILAIAGARRTDQQKAELLAFYRGTVAELKQREQALAAAKQPRPVDPAVQKLRDQHAEVSRPLPVDPKLAQLRHDVQLSASNWGRRG